MLIRLLILALAIMYAAGANGQTYPSPQVGSVKFRGNTSGAGNQTVLQAQPSASGTLSLPAATDTLVGRATTDTLSNKSLVVPSISSPVITGSVTIGGVTQVFPTSGLLVGTTDVQTLTNKSISADQINSGILGSAVAVRPNNLSPSSTPNTPRTVSVSVAPTYNFPESLTTEFDGDFSNTTIPLFFTLNGTVLGQPTTGYQWSPALTPYQTKFINNSGWNQATNGNDGRTGAAVYRTMMQNNGQGDIGAYYAFCTVNSSRSGATTWLANPACIGMNGDFSATISGAYLQGVGDMNFSDSGFDISAIGTAFNFNRTNNVHALGEIWLGHYVHSYGTKAIDAGFTLGGPANVGFDTVTATLPSGAAFNMAQGQKIVFNSTSTSFGGGNFYGDTIGNTYMSYSGSSLLSVVGGIPTLQVSAGSALVAGTLYMTAAPQIQSDHINIQTPKTPATSSAACTSGDQAWDASFIYICVSTNTWKRSAISTW